MAAYWPGHCSNRSRLKQLCVHLRILAQRMEDALASPASTRASAGTLHTPSPQSRACPVRCQTCRDGVPVPLLSSIRAYRMKTIRLKSGTIQQLSPILYVDRPHASTVSRVARAPCAVLLCGWMNGELKYLHKYVAPYKRMFPNATILILLSTLKSTFLSPPAATRSTAELIRDELLRAGRDATVPGVQVRPQMAVHYFSNGGLISLSTLMEHLHDAEMPTPMATIFDCVPGVLSQSILSDAATMTYPPGSWKYWLTLGLVRLYFLRSAWFGYAYHPMDNLNTAKRYQNIPSTWHWSMQGALSKKLPPRLYLYTRPDAYISPLSVAEHAAEAQRVNGEPPSRMLDAERLVSPPVWPPLSEIRTRQLIWDTPSHCQMARQFPDLYWSTVEQFLREAMSLVPDRTSKL